MFQDSKMMEALRHVLLLFVLGLPHVTLIELRLALISYQDYHMLLLTLAGRRARHGRGGPRTRTGAATSARASRGGLGS